MAKNRARTIDNNIIEVIDEILRQWSGKLSWDLLRAAIKDGIGVDYTRQALANHKHIVDAFNIRKRALQIEAGRPISVVNDVAELQKKIAQLEAKNEMLALECKNYRAMFFVWVKNAEKEGISERKLNEPLSPSQQQSTDDIVSIYDVNKKKKS
ncbi:hypothetical protein [Pseudoduganella umbonata]|uniref:Regulator of replication initiation timing n=1 Tax=Pseudoduganella umbonata TaxID=864828 RepID=A0A4P8HV45_9BURK|nr:hypothetical protein [Pseudoduganella umbonata]MBB3222116.1 regulator of replication initiation timing [Pseudoduganella umbonata]QCP12355.1 hypothetical protein FCL38_19465 [Pseudoduganella umbonata]